IRPKRDQRAAATVRRPCGGAPTPVNVYALRTTRGRERESDGLRDGLVRLVIVVPVCRLAALDRDEALLGGDVLPPLDRIGHVDLDSIVEVHLHGNDRVVVLERGRDVGTRGVVLEEEPLRNIDRKDRVS